MVEVKTGKKVEKMVEVVKFLWRLLKMVAENKMACLCCKTAWSYIYIACFCFEIAVCTEEHFSSVGMLLLFPARCVVSTAIQRTSIVRSFDWIAKILFASEYIVFNFEICFFYLFAFKKMIGYHCAIFGFDCKIGCFPSVSFTARCIAHTLRNLAFLKAGFDFWKMIWFHCFCCLCKTL